MFNNTVITLTIQKMLDVLNIFQEYITASTLVPSHPPLEAPTVRPPSIAEVLIGLVGVELEDHLLGAEVLIGLVGVELEEHLLGAEVVIGLVGVVLEVEVEEEDFSRCLCKVTPRPLSPVLQKLPIAFFFCLWLE
jgi:hypothetical protein